MLFVFYPLGAHCMHGLVLIDSKHAHARDAIVCSRLSPPSSHTNRPAGPLPSPRVAPSNTHAQHVLYMLSLLCHVRHVCYACLFMCVVRSALFSPVARTAAVTNVAFDAFSCYGFHEGSWLKAVPICCVVDG